MQQDDITTSRLLWRSIRWAIVAVPVLLNGCTTLAGGERASASTFGCMREAIDQRLPEGFDDASLHCVASGLIALRCSATESMVAGYGKELQDLLGRGNAEWRDLQADRRGRECARRAGEPGLVACCLGDA